MKRALLVTGARSGIGASLVRRFADEFDLIIAASRRVDRMRSEYADLPTVHPVPLGVSNSEELTTYLRDLIRGRDG